MKQSRLMSLAESIANVAVGYGLALATQLIVFPWFGIAASLGDWGGLYRCVHPAVLPAAPAVRALARSARRECGGAIPIMK